MKHQQCFHKQMIFVMVEMIKYLIIQQKTNISCIHPKRHGSHQSDNIIDTHSPIPLVWLKSPLTILQERPSPLQTPQRSSLAEEPMIPSQPIFCPQKKNNEQHKNGRLMIAFIMHTDVCMHTYICVFLSECAFKVLIHLECVCVCVCLCRRGNLLIKNVVFRVRAWIVLM